MTAYLAFRLRWFVVCEPCQLELAFGSLGTATKRRDDHNDRYHRKETDR